MLLPGRFYTTKTQSGHSVRHVPVGRCRAVLVRCFTTHFDLPARDSAIARKRGGQVVGQPSATDTRWV